jgi:hypothetical protein
MSVLVSRAGFPYDAHALRPLSGPFSRVEALPHLAENRVHGGVVRWSPLRTSSRRMGYGLLDVSGL